jgi:hypothetical protein
VRILNFVLGVVLLPEELSQIRYATNNGTGDGSGTAEENTHKEADRSCVTCWTCASRHAYDRRTNDTNHEPGPSTGERTMQCATHETPQTVRGAERNHPRLTGIRPPTRSISLPHFTAEHGVVNPDASQREMGRRGSPVPTPRYTALEAVPCRDLSARDDTAARRAAHFRYDATRCRRRSGTRTGRTPFGRWAEWHILPSSRACWNPPASASSRRFQLRESM